MEKEEVFWYKILIERTEKDDYDKTRFELRIRLRPADMYEIARGVTDYAIREDKMWQLSKKPEK